MYFQKQLSQKRKIFFNFFYHFLNLDSILNILEKKMAPMADVFLGWLSPKDVARSCLKSHVSINPWTSNVLNGPKYCSKQNDRTFTIWIYSCDDNLGWKSLCEWNEKS